MAKLLIRVACLLALALSPAMASAEDSEAVATGRPSEAPPAAEAPLELPTERDAGPPEDPRLGRCGDRKPHGQVTVGVGTRGYREASGMVVAPVGECGYVAVGVATVRGGGVYGPEPVPGPLGPPR